MLFALRVEILFVVRLTVHRRAPCVSRCHFVYYVCSDGAVAWCVHCNKFLTPPTVTPEGNCPRCGRPVERGLIPGMTRSADDPEPPVPWHLKLLGSALALYLGYRALQLIDWVFHH